MTTEVLAYLKKFREASPKRPSHVDMCEEADRACRAALSMAEWSLMYGFQPNTKLTEDQSREWDWLLTKAENLWEHLWSMVIQEWNMFKSGCLDEYEAFVKKRGADQIGRAVAALKSMADTCNPSMVDTGDFEEGTAEQVDKAASDFKGVVVALQMAPKDGSMFINFASAVTAAVDAQRKTRAWQAAPELKQKSSFRDHLTTSLRALKSAIIDMDAEQAETTVFMKSFDWENVDTKGIDAMVGKVRRILS